MGFDGRVNLSFRDVSFASGFEQCVSFSWQNYGRGGGVGRALGVNAGLGVGEGLSVEVGVAVAVAVSVGLAVTVGVDVGVGLSQNGRAESIRQP